jgi:hypothetical protein
MTDPPPKPLDYATPEPKVTRPSVDWWQVLMRLRRLRNALLICGLIDTACHRHRLARPRKNASASFARQRSTYQRHRPQ